MTGVGLSASVVVTGLVYWSVARVRLCRKLGIQNPNSRTRAMADGDLLLGARFLLPVCGSPRRENEADVPREARGGGDKLRGVPLGSGAERFSDPTVPPGPGSVWSRCLAPP